jgi:hypothetical protein
VAALGPVPTAVTAKGVGRVDGKTVSALLRQRLSGLSEPTPEAEP